MDVFARQECETHVDITYRLDERQRYQVVFDEGDVGRKPRHSLVHVQAVKLGDCHGDQRFDVAGCGDRRPGAIPSPLERVPTLASPCSVVQ
jgi:hypothetical protein